MGKKAKSVKSKKKFEVRPSMLAACIQMTRNKPDDTAPGILLYCMMLRQKKKWVWEDEDGEWMILTGEEWEIDAALTRHQVARAIKILKDKELIEFKHDKIRHRDRYLQLFVRVPDSTVAAAKKIMKIKEGSAIPDSDGGSAPAPADSETLSPSATPDHTINDKMKENEKIINDFSKDEKKGIGQDNKKEHLEEGSKDNKDKGSKDNKDKGSYGNKDISNLNNKELGLFYVGITRVKAVPQSNKAGTLILTSCRQMPVADVMGAGIAPASVQYGDAQLNASRFIAELGMEAPDPVRG